DDLATGTLRTTKVDGRALVLGRTDDGEAFALDNRCPHEGYPLSTGELKGERLTCSWHNWKFDVRDGRCLVGGEGVRHYPVREVGGALEVDLADPDPAATIATARNSLIGALETGDVGRALRDAVRMLGAGATPADLLVDVCADDARRAEYGTTHALAAAADVLRIAEDGPEAIRALAHPIELAAEENLRLPPRAEVAPLGDAVHDDGASLVAAVEEEDEARARGLLAGAFAAGVDRATVERWIHRALARHFTGFGHELIYVTKGRELLDHVEPARAAEVWPGLLVSAVMATREDTLPYMRGYFARFDEAAGTEEALARLAGGSGAHHDRAALRAAVLDAERPAAAVDALVDALAAGSAPSEVAKDLVVAAAHRLLRFDEAHDRDPDVAEGWLWATHRLTFAAAVRHATLGYAEPDVVRFLLQSVAFTHSGRAMDAPPERRDAPPSAADVEAAAADGGEAALWRALESTFVRPIFVAHALKTTVVGLEEREALGDDPERDVPLGAALRFLAARPAERTVPAQAEVSRRFVMEGAIPKKLTQ
ncbi:MAG: Rieske (2Fe-2S) protein, partial [Planctomycetota bacterium JB042]